MSKIEELKRLIGDMSDAELLAELQQNRAVVIPQKKQAAKKTMTAKEKLLAKLAKAGVGAEALHLVEMDMEKE